MLTWITFGLQLIILGLLCCSLANERSIKRGLDTILSTQDHLRDNDREISTLLTRLLVWRRSA